MAESFRTISAVVLLTALCVAPLNFGSTRPIGFETLIALVATGGATWLCSCGVGRTWEFSPLVASFGIGLVAVSIVAWLLFISPPVPPLFTRQHYARITERWPYSIVPRDFSLLMIWAATAAVALLALRDLARDPVFRRGIAAVMLVTGAVVAALGLAQNATRANGIFWDTTHRMPGAFFGTFYHHTSAGAYLNTVWPLGFALGLVGIRQGGGRPRAHLLIFGAFGCAAIVLAAHAGHISRFPQVIAVGALLAFALWAGIWRVLGESPGVRRALCVLAGALAVGVIGVGASRGSSIAARWNLLHVADLRGGRAAVAPPPARDWPRLMRDDLFVPSDHRAYFLGDRGAAYSTAIAAVAVRPWFGWGPGGWTAAAAANSQDPFVRTFFLFLQFTHCDYLQACVEWGLVGAAGWALLIPGSVLHALARLRLRPSRDFIGAAAVVGLTAVLAQSLIDFPLQIPAIQFNAVALAALAWSVPATAAVASSPSLS